LLLVYWLFLILFPAYDLISSDKFSPEGNLTGFIERILIPGKYYDPEQVFTLLPATGTAMLGILTGEFILSEYLINKPLRKALYLVSVAIALIIAGKIWDKVLPINRSFLELSQTWMISPG